MCFDRELLALIGAPSTSSVLVLRALGLGDLLTAVPALRALRRGRPDSVLTVAAPAWLAPLLRLTDAVDVHLPIADMSALGPVDPPPELAVNLHGRGPQSIAALQRTGAAKILTHRHPDQPRLGGPEWDPSLHEVHRWCRLVSSAGFDADPADLQLASPRVPPLVHGAVVIHPGASAPARRWPSDRFAAVARALAGRGETVVVTGSAAEGVLCGQLVSRAELPAEADLSGRLGLAELAALVAAARLVVSGDTGVAHLASAYGTASVLLFGPTTPASWGPPATGPHSVLWRGRTGDPHADRPDPGLLEIGVGEVLRAAVRRLEG